MLIAPLVGILYRVPNGDDVRVKVDVSLTTIGRIPQIGVPFTIDYRRTTDHFPMILGYKQLSMFVLHQFAEE